MRTFVVEVPQTTKISNLGFATSVVEKANTYTSEDINIKISNSQYVNAKSILGLISLRYDSTDSLTVQVIGENEDYSAKNFERFLLKLVDLYSND